MKSHGGTVNGRTLAQLEAQRERLARMQRDNYEWKLRLRSARHSSGRTPTPGWVIERRDGAR
jgi:hypothetical protein